MARHAVDYESGVCGFWCDLPDTSIVRSYTNNQHKGEERQEMAKKSRELREILLIGEMSDGKCYQFVLSDNQNIAIRAVLNQLPDTVKMLDEPLEGVVLHRNIPTKKKATKAK